jgi:uncharacterized protein YutE (UPF0331/DUF86 family)
LELERSARDLLTRKGIAPPPPTMPPSRRSAMLLDSGLITKDEFEWFNRLVRLRNTAVHDHEEKVSPEAARQYVALAVPLIERLKQK